MRSLDDFLSTLPDDQQQAIRRQTEWLFAQERERIAAFFDEAARQDGNEWWPPAAVAKLVRDPRFLQHHSAAEEYAAWIERMQADIAASVADLRGTTPG